MKNKWLAATMVITVMAFGIAYTEKKTEANEQVLGDSQNMGLGTSSNTQRQNNAQNKPPEKISPLGGNAYIRQYNEYGQPMVEVHPEEGPSYYYNEEEVQQPNPEDGVHFRNMPEWRLKEW